MIAQDWPTRIITDLPAAEYHAMKALSASGAWLLAEDCPAKFLWRSPWNPLRQAEDKSEFDIGTAAHLAVLEAHEFAARTEIVDASDYRTNRARELRDNARAEGKVPLLHWQHDIVRAIAGSIRAHPIAAEAFIGGLPEVTLTWRCVSTGVPCKARVDWLPRHGRWLVELKSAASANPRLWRDQAYRFGYHARAAWYLDGAEATTGRRAEEYWFVVVEKEPPYLVSVVAFDEAALEWGRMTNRRACELFLRSVEAGDWPGYREPHADRDRAFRIGLPPWALYQLQDSSEAGEFGHAHRGAANNAHLLRAAESRLPT
jgi:hypothetical protein